MLDTTPIGLDAVLNGLKAAGESTRLRILLLLRHGDLTVKDLTEILGQSQPRMSRHLRLLAEAGLIQRYPEGAWVYYRQAESGRGARIAQALLALPDLSDPVLVRDRERLEQVRAGHADVAARYFAANASEWDRIRSLHVADEAVEAAMVELIGDRPFEALLDLGTGTGRALEVFAPFYNRGVGVDSSQSMLAVARANLERSGLNNAQVRHGDLFNLNLARQSFDVVCLHQVLHYLNDPVRAVAEAARMLRPSGRLLVVDFAPHDLEFLRDQHAHRRLGFGNEEIASFMEAAGLETTEIRDLPPEGKNGQGLTVTLWLGRDPRLLIADNDRPGAGAVA